MAKYAVNALFTDGEVEHRPGTVVEVTSDRKAAKWLEIGYIAPLPDDSKPKKPTKRKKAQ